jgi:hypothetical protein
LRFPEFLGRDPLQTHDGVVTQSDPSHRKGLYRVLDERDLIVAHGGQRVWNLFVTGPGEPLPRFVSALKLAPALYAGLELGPVFQGGVEPARARRAGRGGSS